MSSRPVWSFRLPLRPDVHPATLRVLEAVARDTPPDPADLATLHPVVAHYLGDWTRMLTNEEPPHVGPPVRLSGLGGATPLLTIEFTQHDDEFANGGWVMFLWAYQLTARPARGRVLIGHHAPADRESTGWQEVVADATGVASGEVVVGWDEITGEWQRLLDDPAWAGWS
ncbi:hypothetical protein [Cellulomonas pakistanensis]|uniref:Uncharacterized protein n=1 Tax=Cellulomonas pakistanensis TaxID=992287 RepID=A0A919PAR0_9CELL|nr:hypothetical protein [Cellulomonas pakistanensis]GIG36213.1 hypothetical protein Cpa01nite_15940 [Cellulomonas pakistanensis]